MEYISLNNGVKMPILGYGVYQVTKEECERCVLDALKVGYRAIDTASGLFVYCLMNSLSSMLAGLFSGFSMLSTSSLSGLNVDFAPVFFKSFFFVAIYFVTLAGMITLMGKVIFKADTNFKKILTAVGLSSVIMICALILGAIFSYVKFGLAFVFLIVGVIFSIIYLAFATSESLNVTKDKVAYALVPSIAVALFVMLYILPKIFS